MKYFYYFPFLIVLFIIGMFIFRSSFPLLWIVYVLAIAGILIFILTKKLKKDEEN